MFESFLSFVGLGIQPPTASWGVLIQEGWKTLSSYPHLILIPSLILFLTVLSFNLIFEDIKDHLDPRQRPL
jgi:oligopeptide transport system permease protein